MRCGGKDLVSRSRTAEVIMVARFTIDGDEERTAFGDPLRNGVREAFADRTIHGTRVAGRGRSGKNVLERKAGLVTCCSTVSRVIGVQGFVTHELSRLMQCSRAPAARWDSGPYQASTDPRQGREAVSQRVLCTHFAFCLQFGLRAPAARWDSGPYLCDYIHFVLAKGGKGGHLFRFSN
jgi:hypothetical protein